MKVTCFGSRGSIPSPSVAGEFITEEFGGNTTCYYLEAGEFNIIVDMGSGGNRLGKWLMKNGKIGEHFIYSCGCRYCR